MIRETEVSGRKIYLTLPGLTSSSASQRAWVPPTIDPDAKYRVNAAAARWSVASTSGLIQIEVAGIDVAAGSGVNQLANALDTSKTKDENVNSSAITNPTVFDNNSSVNLILSGTLTGLADCVVTIEIEKVN